MTFIAATAAAVRMDMVMPVIAEFLYSAEEPLVVHMRLVDEATREHVSFQFARDLLDALFAADRDDISFGTGDVTIEQLDRGTCLKFGLMSLRDIRYYFVVEADVVRDFIIRSFVLVPRHKESAAIDVDAAIAKVMGS
jgi:hypothetical protein